mgnify:CR=1 FL=1
MRRSYKEKTEARMKLLGVTAVDMGNTLGKPKSRVSEALSGETTDAAEALRLRIDRTLTGMTDERRRELEAELEAERDVQCPHLEGRLSVIMPEDLIYIVTEDGMPVGVWIPQTNKIQPLEPALMRVTGRKVK